MSAQLINCPHCGKDDAVQKVAAVYRGGVSTVEYQEPVSVSVKGQTVYGTVNKTAVSQTELSKRLKPPNPNAIPATPEGQRKTRIGGIILIASILLFGIPLCLVTGGLQLLPMLSHDAHAGANAYMTSAIIGPILCLPLVIAIVGVALYLRKGNRAYGDKALAKWNRLFYCARCDGVFIPGESRFVPTEQITPFLYE